MPTLGQTVAADDLRPDMLVVVRTWHALAPGAFVPDAYERTMLAYMDPTRDLPTGAPMLVHAVLLPFFAAEDLRDGRRFAFDTRRAELLFVTPAFVEALMPGALARQRARVQKPSPTPPGHGAAAMVVHFAAPHNPFDVRPRPE